MVYLMFCWLNLSIFGKFKLPHIGCLSIITFNMGLHKYDIFKATDIFLCSLSFIKTLLNNWYAEFFRLYSFDGSIFSQYFSYRFEHENWESTAPFVFVFYSPQNGWFIVIMVLVLLFPTPLKLLYRIWWIFHTFCISLSHCAALIFFFLLINLWGFLFSWWRREWSGIT